MPQPKVELTGPSGYKAEVTSGNRLKVEADLSVIGDVNIGNVDVHLDGGVPLLGNAGAVAAGVLRVTLASDDPAVVDLAAMEVLLGTIDSDTDAIKTAVQLLDNAVDGNYLNVNQNIAGTDVDGGSGNKSAQTQRVVIATDDIPIALVNTKLDHLSDNLDTLETTNNAIQVLLGTIDSDTDAIKTAVQILDDWDDSNYANVNINLAGSDAQAGEGAITAATQRVTIATDDDGVAHLATMVAWDATHDSTAPTHGTLSMGSSKVYDAGPFPGNVNAENEAVTFAASIYGVQYSMLVTESGASTMGFVDNGNATTTPGLLTTGGVYRATPDTYADNDACVNQHDINGNLKTTHSINGMVSDVNSDVDGSEAQQLDGSTSGLDVACKRGDLMATHDNTGYIWVGDSGVTANGGGGGMRLAPGDFYSIDVNNLNDIWVIATVDEENIHYIYYT